MQIVKCPYCDNPAKLVTGKVIYPLLRNHHRKKYWLCKPCEAYVGTHADNPDNIPLGSLANPELRRLRISAHRAFDPIWKTNWNRRRAYLWLASALKIDSRKCHIGMFNAEMCKKTITICNIKCGV